MDFDLHILLMKYFKIAPKSVPFWKCLLFMPPAWKVRREHLVIGSSVRPSVCNSAPLTKCNIYSLGDDIVTKLVL